MAMTRLATRLQHPAGNDRYGMLGWMAHMPAQVVSCMFNYAPLMLRTLGGPLTRLYRHFWLPVSTQRNAVRLQARASYREMRPGHTEELAHFHERLRLARESACLQSVDQATSMFRQAVWAIEKMPHSQRRVACIALIDTCGSCLTGRWRDVIWEEMRLRYGSLPHADREPMFDAFMTAGSRVSAKYQVLMLDYLWPYRHPDNDVAPKALEAVHTASQNLAHGAGYRAITKVMHRLPALAGAGRHALVQRILAELPCFDAPHAVAIACDLLAYAPMLEGGPEHGALSILRAILHPSARLEPERKRGLIMMMRDGLPAIVGARARSDVRKAIGQALASLPRMSRSRMREAAAHGFRELDRDVRCRNLALRLVLAKTCDKALAARLQAKSLADFKDSLSRLSKTHETPSLNDKLNALQILVQNLPCCRPAPGARPPRSCSTPACATCPRSNGASYGTG